ncbi:MAG: methyltransferase domain-containing protein [Thermoleophilaceae bacterium]
MTQTACRICEGPLQLRYRGDDAALTPEVMAPTNHAPGRHGDLYACGNCGTVQQPGGPRGEELAQLYRGMGDDHYLTEEAGRRATAARLLDSIADHVPAGRLLDVGCGHGLLLDEARSRGYSVTGLELSETAASYAREVLQLDVLEQSIEELAAGEVPGFQVIVMADVLEHLDDPLAALDACERLLAPGGVLCVITPDPSSRTARLAGPRWWAYIPAHTFLFPRLTMRELLESRGLVISEDQPLRRSFTLGYWARGLGQRAGRLATAADAVTRTRAGRRRLTLSLADERLVLAHKVPVTRAPKPLMRNRGTDFRVHVVLPAYNAAKTIPEVAASMPVDAADAALLVDDASADDTSEVALSRGFDVIRTPANRGYGGNQKTSYVRAILDGADAVVMVHADNQYDPALVARMVKPIEADIADVVVGSRLLEDETIAGGMPRWKWIGNRVLTSIENLAFRRGYSEYHTGYRAFSTDILRSIAFLRNDDGFVFDQQIFAQLIAAHARVIELPIPTRYFREASSVSFSASVKYGLRTLAVLVRYRLDERRPGWSLLRPPAAQLSAPGARKRRVSARR